jgi:spore germination protein GerM
MSRRPARVLLPTLGAALAVAAAGCGIDPQAGPEAITLSAAPVTETPTATGTPGRDLVLWFLRDGRLAPMTREASDGDTPAVLDLLAEGPTATEVSAGLGTALLAQQPGLEVVDEDPDDPLVTVQVGQQFLSLTGTDQLPAVAQVVWTVTELPGVDEVLFATESGPLEVPTDDGLTAEPVRREDYASLAPETGGSATPTRTAGSAPRTAGSAPRTAAPTPTG